MPSKNGSSSTKTAKSTPLRLLLVEDTLLTVELIRGLIDRVSYKFSVSVAATEKEAVNMASASNPDVVILDLRLKQGNGFSVLRELVTMENKPTVIVATNFGLPKFRDYAFLSGADYFLDKARDLETLPSILDKIVRKRAENKNFE